MKLGNKEISGFRDFEIWGIAKSKNLKIKNRKLYYLASFWLFDPSEVASQSLLTSNKT